MVGGKFWRCTIIGFNHLGIFHVGLLLALAVIKYTLASGVRNTTADATRTLVKMNTTSQITADSIEITRRNITTSSSTARPISRHALNSSRFTNRSNSTFRLKLNPRPNLRNISRTTTSAPTTRATISAPTYRPTTITENSHVLLTATTEKIINNSSTFYNSSVSINDTAVLEERTIPLGDGSSNRTFPYVDASSNRTFPTSGRHGVNGTGNSSVERSVSVSFDNTKIYFFGDKIEFAGEVHNRYPQGQGEKQGAGNSEVGRPSGGQDSADDNPWGSAAATYGLRPPKNMTRVHYIDAECQNDYMKISILFSGAFSGLIYSSKYAYNPDCLYVTGNGVHRYEFLIKLNSCGTLGGRDKGRSDDEKKMMWNTLTVQYSPLIEEEWDEHFRVTCEYGYQYWKKVSFPVLNVNVATENPLLFTLSPPECQMEIRSGFNVSGNRIGEPVSVGDPLTLVIYMRSPTVGFDIIISNCHAHNGAQKRMRLIDEDGCPQHSKLISDFRGIDVHDGVYESKVYAFFKAFRFTGSPALYIECDVRMCHGICPKQRCYWRNLRDRGEESTSESSVHIRSKRFSTGAENDKNSSAISNTLNLFQSLEVRSDEILKRDSTAVVKGDETGTVCMRKVGFTALLCVMMLLMVVIISLCCFLWVRVCRHRSLHTAKRFDPPDFVPPFKTRI